MTLQINSAFDAGNIIVRSIADEQVRLAIRADTASDFLQWFHFRLDGRRAVPCRVVIENAGDTTYPRGWENYDVVASHDGHRWFRIPADFARGELSWQVDAGSASMWFAYFAPYSLERHERLVAAMGHAPEVVVERLGKTLDGRTIDCLHMSRAGVDVRPQIWAIARQHPGESMASWWMEGWLERLSDPDDAVACALRASADIHTVPNMNPDGCHRGNLRTNANGANLNREWASPTLEASPEVFHVRQRMHETGVTLALDVHGDEALPYNFIAGTEGIPSWNEKRDDELIAFKRTLAALNPDFQTAYGYPRSRPGSANLSYASNYIGETFNCLAMTLEMPFKDTADTPRPDVGWSPERCMRLGRSFVDAVHLSLKKQRIS